MNGFFELKETRKFLKIIVEEALRVNAMCVSRHENHD